MKKVLVTLTGCDMWTDIHMEATEEEIKFLVRVAALSAKVSTIDCEPIMKVIREEEQV